jgi:Galactose oxidase, central domain/Kelch motif
MKHRPLALAIAAVALVASACGTAATTTPSAAPSPLPTAAATATPSPTPSGMPSATTPAGQMTHGRSLHTATTLADARILIAGGYFDNVPISSADLYDPKTGTFTATGPMTTARGFDTATRLADGRVLVAGGNPGNWDFAGELINSAELYDPNTGTFSPTGSMTTARDVHTATLLLDGRVLVTGGDDTYPHPVASAELYDPKTGTFSPTGSMTTVRDWHTATLLADGRVLVAGGTALGMQSGTSFLASAEVYDPKTGRFTATGSMSAARASHVATLLPDGRVLVTGGQHEDSGASLASAELYNPKTGKFTSTGPMTAARTFHDATVLADGRVLVTGGDLDGWGYSGHYLASAEIFDPKTGTFTATGSMTDVRTSLTTTLLPDGRVLAAGGYDGKADLATAELYDPKTGTFSPTSPGG